MFQAKTCEIEGLIEIETTVFSDSRGAFSVSYSKEEFSEIGITDEFVQDNQSCSHKNVLRGLHFQTLHPQAKLVRAVSGKIFDVAVDLRNGSPTFGKWHGVILNSEKQNLFYIPKGFAHGFLALTDNCIQSYKCTDFYDPKGEGGLMWNDKTIAIDWTSVAPSITPLLSDKDTKHPAFDVNGKYFDLNANWIGE